MELQRKKSNRPLKSIHIESQGNTLDIPAHLTPNISNIPGSDKFRVAISSKKQSIFLPESEANFATPNHMASMPFLSPFGPNVGSTRSRAIRLTQVRVDRASFRSVDFSKRGLSVFHPAEQDDGDAYKKRLATPIKDERVVIDDEKDQEVVGKEACTDFYSHYKKLDRVKDVNHFMQVKDAVYTSVLGKSESLNLLPTKMGFIKEKGDFDKVQLNHFRMGDKYAQVLSEGLKSVKGFQKLELANNRISAIGADHLLSKLSFHTEILNLSGNSIGKIGIDHLCNNVSLKNTRLIEINLEGNKLGDVAVGMLCDAIAYNSTVRRLNIGKNFLSDNSTEKISKMLELNTTLEELYLQWNQIKSAGGITIVNGLKSASKLKVLDLSWNSLGQNGSQFAKAFATYIGANTTLVHLDLSNNYITMEDAKVIAEELKHNHTLYGFHFQGNVGYVDHKGFLIVDEHGESNVKGRVIQPPINSVKYQHESIKHHIGNWENYKDVCWICEGWRPLAFNWTPGESGTSDQDPIYVHISFEGYRGVFLNSKKEFTNVRMVPPTKFDFFFVADETPCCAEDQKKDKPQNPFIKTKVNGEEKHVRLEASNYCLKSSMFEVINEDYDPVDLLKDHDIRPRVPDEDYFAPEVQIIRPQWKFPVGIFRSFRIDTQALLDDCFKVDFEGCRISKIVKNPDDLKAVRDIMAENYRALKDCYKHYSAIGAPSDIWSIPLNTFTELCNVSKIIDNKVLKLSDFDRIFIATYTKPADKEKNHRNPDRALVRHQFLEGLVRLAEHKYLSSGVVTTYGESMRLLMEECMGPYLATFNHNSWRQERYWNEEVDTVLKSYFPIFRSVYRKYHGQKTLPGQKKFMCLEEFHRLVADANMNNDNCGERDATLGFSLAMMTQVDELNSDRIYQMQFVEFLEALSRVADKFSAHPYGWNPINPITGQQETETPYEQRAAQPLYIKLEGLMPALFTLCGNDVKELWSLPETSIFQMKEVDPKQKFSTKKKKILRINPTHASSIEPYDGFNANQV